MPSSLERSDFSQSKGFEGQQPRGGFVGPAAINVSAQIKIGGWGVCLERPGSLKRRLQHLLEGKLGMHFASFVTCRDRRHTVESVAAER